MLVVSLLLPHPAVLFAQEATPVVETDTTTSTEASTPEAPTASEDVAAPMEESGDTEEAEAPSEEGSEEGGEEPPPEGLLDEQDPDPEYGDERAPRSRQPLIEPDQLDGSLRYLHPLVIPPGRNGMQPDLALVYSSRPDEQISPFGYGWSINIPYIERINRRGVDKLYNEYNFYSTLDGELASTTGGEGGIGDLAGEEALLNIAELSPFATAHLSTEEPEANALDELDGATATSADPSMTTRTDTSDVRPIEDAPESALESVLSLEAATSTPTDDGLEILLTEVQTSTPRSVLAESEPILTEAPTSVALATLDSLLLDKPADERATMKGLEIAKIGAIEHTKRAHYDIEIVSMKSIPEGVEVLARAWGENGQIGFGRDGSIDIERFRFINPPVLIDDPNGNIVRTSVDSRTLETIERRLREDPKEALLQSLEHVINVKKQKHQHPISSKEK